MFVDFGVTPIELDKSVVKYLRKIEKMNFEREFIFFLFVFTIGLMV